MIIATTYLQYFFFKTYILPLLSYFRRKLDESLMRESSSCRCTWILRSVDTYFWLLDLLLVCEGCHWLWWVVNTRCYWLYEVIVCNSLWQNWWSFLKTSSCATSCWSISTHLYLLNIPLALLVITCFIILLIHYFILKNFLYNLLIKIY